MFRRVEEELLSRRLAYRDDQMVIVTARPVVQPGKIDGMRRRGIAWSFVLTPPLR